MSKGKARKGSKKNQKLQRKRDIHHFFWPKAVYKKRGLKNRTLEMAYNVHHDYHNFFMGNCKNPTGRECKNGGYCKFEGICCYCQTLVPYGECVL